MSTAALRGVVRGLVLDGPPSDAALVTRYAKLNDHAAFAELLRRHGPVVLGVCRRTLGHADADDAFQAVFLVLARKAGDVRPPGSVGGWLYGVAVRVAKKAKVAAARRWRREMATVANPERERGGSSPVEQADLRAVIDAELARLPDKLRLPVVLCDLGGKTRSEAARELGLPDGTVAARLHQARKLLAGRLTRRGVALPATGVGALAAAEPVRADLARTTLAAAEAFARGGASPVISTTAQALAEGVVRAMSAGSWKVGLGVALAAVLAAGGGLMWASDGPKPARGGAPEGGARPEAKVTHDVPGYVADVAFSPDGKQYAVVAGKVTVHDAATGKVRWTAPGEAARFVPGPKVAPLTGPGGERIEQPSVHYIAVLGADRLDYRRAASGEIVFRLRPGNPPPKADKGWHLVRLSPDARRYVAHTGFGVRVYDAEAGGEPVRLAGQHEPGSSSLAPAGKDVFFSPDGKKVVGVGVLIEPGRMGIAEWRLDTGERVQALAEYAPGGGPMAAAYSPDGKTFAAAYTDHIALWPEPKVAPPDAADRVERGPRRAPKRVAPAGTPTAVAFSPDGKSLAIGVRVPLHPTRLNEGQKTEVQLLDAATGKELRRFDGFAPGLPVSALAFSPDGKTLLAGTGYPNVTAIPDDAPRAGEVKLFALAPEAAPPKDEPKPDSRPAIVERNQDLWAWQERPAKPNPQDRPGPAGSVAVAPDGKTVAAGGPAGKVSVYDAATRKLLWSFTDDHPDQRGAARAHPAAVAYSPDGKWLAVTRVGGVSLLDAGTGKLVRTIEEKGAKPTAVAFGPAPDVEGFKQHRLAFTDGRSLWAKSWLDGGEPGTAVMGPMGGTAKPDGVVPAGVAYSPSGKQVVFIPNAKIDPAWAAGPRPTLGSNPQKDTHWYAQVWGAGSGEPMMLLPHGTEPVTAVAWSPDGRIATGGADGVVVLWDRNRDSELKRVKMSGPVTALAFRSDGKRFAAGVMAPEKPGEAGAVRIAVVTEQEGSSPNNWMTSSTVGLPAAEVVKSLAFSPDGLLMIAGTATADGKGGGLRVWDRLKLAPKDGDGEPPAAAPKSDPPPAAAAPAPTWAAKARLTDLAEPVGSIAFAPDGKALYAGGVGGRVVALDPAGPRVRWQYAPDPGGRAAVAVSPDGKRVLATRGLDREAALLDAATGRPVPAAGRLGAGDAAAFSPDGAKLAVGGGYWAYVLPAAGGEPEVDIATQESEVDPATRTGRAVEPGPTALAWSPDGKRLAYSDKHAGTGLWRVGVYEKERRGQPAGFGEDWRIRAVAYAPDGKTIAYGGAGGDVVVFDVETYEERLRTKIVGRGGGSTIHALAFGPDGKTLAAGVELDAGKGVNRVVLIDPATGREGHHLTGNAPVPVSAVAWSPDGKTLAVAHGPSPGDGRKYTPEELKEGGVVLWERGPER